MTPVRLEPAAPRSRVKLSTTEPLRSLARTDLCHKFKCHMVSTKHNPVTLNQWTKLHIGDIQIFGVNYMAIIL